MRILIDAESITREVRVLGERISEKYRDRPLTVLGVLTGSVMFLADLARSIAIPHRIGVIQASSYRGATTRPADLVVNTEWLPDIRGRDVLLADDILDSGRTLQAVVDRVREAGARSVETAVLLSKAVRREISIQPDYCCFEIPDLFVVGYGLDYGDEYRSLPHVAALEEGDFTRGERE